MNKFAQVSNDDHQMSVAGERRWGGGYRRSHVGGGVYPTI